jgi:hypothetical protein
MTQLLESAIAKIQALSPAEQDHIASVFLEELADEQRWDAAFAGSQDKLSQMARQARSDIEAGRISDVGFDEL